MGTDVSNFKKFVRMEDFRPGAVSFTGAVQWASVQTPAALGGLLCLFCLVLSGCCFGLLWVVLCCCVVVFVVFLGVCVYLHGCVCVRVFPVVA